MRKFENPLGPEANTQTLEDITPEDIAAGKIEVLMPVKIETGDPFSLIARVERLEITSPETAKEATDLGIQMKKLIKQKEIERDWIVGPLKDHIGVIVKRYKVLFIAPLTEGIKAIKDKLIPYQLAEQEKRDKEKEEERVKEEDALLKEADAVEEVYPGMGEKLIDSAASTAPKAEKANVETGSGSKSILKKRWTYKVTDILKLAQHDPGLVIEQAALIRKLISEGIRKIPGTEIYQENSVSFKG